MGLSSAGGGGGGGGGAPSVGGRGMVSISIVADTLLTCPLARPFVDNLLSKSLYPLALKDVTGTSA